MIKSKHFKLTGTNRKLPIRYANVQGCTKYSQGTAAQVHSIQRRFHDILILKTMVFKNEILTLF